MRRDVAVRGETGCERADKLPNECLGESCLLVGGEREEDFVRVGAAQRGAAACEGTPCGRTACEGVSLRRDELGLALVGDGMEVRGDFMRMIPRLKSGKLERELLVRAAKVKGVRDPVAIDATAGLGEDALLLAAAGFTVRMYERDPTIAALLRDALRRAAAHPQLANTVSRMRLFEGDSLAALFALSAESPAESTEGAPSVPSACAASPAPPDVIYLDPMFPERGKSAAVKKKFQLLHYLENPCSDEDARALLGAAIAANPRKVVVKRPAKGPYLAGVKPSYSLAGKAVRYDCIVPASCSWC